MTGPFDLDSLFEELGNAAQAGDLPHLKPKGKPAGDKKTDPGPAASGPDQQKS